VQVSHLIPETLEQQLYFLAGIGSLVKRIQMFVNSMIIQDTTREEEGSKEEKKDYFVWSSLTYQAFSGSLATFLQKFHGVVSRDIHHPKGHIVTLAYSVI
jgi:hypothetical protein